MLYDFITREIVKDMKSVFKILDAIIEYEDSTKDGSIVSEDEKHALWKYNNNKKKLGTELIGLVQTEISYETFAKYTENKRYLPFLKEAYESNKEYLDSLENWLRLKETPCGSKRTARKELERFMKKLKKDDPLITKLFFSKVSGDIKKEAVYYLRDWLINDFDVLIDTIEPVRQEYIISRKGQVTVDEVENMLLEKFPDDYEDYSHWVNVRPSYAMVYYPDLEI